MTEKRKHFGIPDKDRYGDFGKKFETVGERSTYVVKKQECRCGVWGMSWDSKGVTQLPGVLPLVPQALAAPSRLPSVNPLNPLFPFTPDPLETQE